MEALPVNEGISMDSSSAMEYSPILEQQANENPDCSQIPDMKHEVNDIDMYTKLEHIISEEVHITKSEDDAAEGSKISPRDQHCISTTSDLELVVSEEVGEESQNDDEAFVSESPDMKHDVCDIDVYMKLEPIISEEVHITKCEDDNAEGSKASLRYQHCISTTCDLELVVTEEVGEESQNDDEAFVSESPDMKHDVSDIDVYMKLEPIISEEVHITKCEDDYAEGSKGSPRYQPCISTTSDLELAVSEEVGEESQNDDEAFVSEIPDMKHDVSDIDVYMKLEPIISEEVHITKCEDDYAEGSKSSPRYQRCISTTSDLELAVSEEVGEESQNDDEAFVSEIPDMKHDVSDIDVYMKLEPIISEEVHITKCEDDYAEGSKASPRYQHCISTTSDLELAVSEEVGEESQNDDEAFVSEIPDMKHDVSDIDVYMKLEPIISEEVHITKCEDDYAEGSKSSPRDQHCISTTSDLELVVSEEVGEESQNDDEAFVSESPDMKHDVSDIDVYMKLEPIISEEVHITKSEDNDAEGSEVSPRDQHFISTNCDLEPVIMEEVHEKSEDDDEAFKPSLDRNQLQLTPTDRESTLFIQNSLQQHIQTKKLNNHFECYNCGYTCNKKSKLRSHIFHHKGEKPFKCNVCSFTSNHKNHLEKHVVIHTGEKPFQCSECSYTCNRKSSLKTHILTHSNKKLFKCNVCSYTCKQKSYLEKHVVIHTGEKPFQCNECSYTCNRRSSLKRHILTHSSKKPFECNVCSYTCHQKDYLEKHLVIPTGEKPFQCNERSYTCNRKGSLKRHILTHSSKKLFKCNVCSYTCKRKDHLEKHVVIHTGEKPFQCNECSYTCNRKSSLKTHILTHSSKKLFKCNVCSYTCHQKDYLEKHVVIHTGEKPFQCNECSYTCNRKSSLKRHILTHSSKKLFKCNVCSYTCKRKDHLEKHVIIHTGEKPFECNECSYTCNRKSSLKTHIFTHSSKKPNVMYVAIHVNERII